MDKEKRKKYNQKHYRKNKKNGKLQSENSSIYYKKIKKLGYDMNYILVKAMHGNPINRRMGTTKSIPHKIKLGE